LSKLVVPVADLAEDAMQEGGDLPAGDVALRTEPVIGRRFAVLRHPRLGLGVDVRLKERAIVVGGVVGIPK
jgi:hypothetical protein